LAMVESKMSYASTATFPSMKCQDLEVLQRLSRSAIRSFCGLPRWANCDHLFRRYSIRRIDQVFAAKVLVFTYRCLHSLGSELFDEYFVPSDGQRTRGSAEKLLIVPFWRGPSGRSTIQFRAAIMWNRLPPAVRTKARLPLFRDSVKALRCIDYSL